jgi:hypothetical protein
MDNNQLEWQRKIIREEYLPKQQEEQMDPSKLSFRKRKIINKKSQA